MLQYALYCKLRANSGIEKKEKKEKREKIVSSAKALNESEQDVLDLHRTKN